MDISTNTTTAINLARRAVGAEWSWRRILRLRTMIRLVRIMTRLAGRLIVLLARITNTILARLIILPLADVIIIPLLRIIEVPLLCIAMMLLCIAIMILRITIILLLITRILAGLTIIPLVRAVFALARLARVLLATSPVPKLLGIRPGSQECRISRSSSCGGCLLQLLLVGALVVSGLQLANSTVRRPGFRRSPETYAVVYFFCVGCPGIWLAQLWWSCLV